MLTIKEIRVAYGRNGLAFPIREENIGDIITPSYQKQDRDPAEILKDALSHPIESKTLAELSAGAKRILLITNDHTRPMPSRLTLPAILSSLARPKEDYEISILMANGLHRRMTEGEIREKLGAELCEAYKVYNHDAKDEGGLYSLGVLSNGSPLLVNKLLREHDLVIAEGFIEPHFFAGFSGGRKSVVPGVAGAETILANHRPENIASPNADMLSLADNPVHQEFLEALRLAPLHFILNIAMDGEKNILAAFAGHPEHAHAAGCEYVRARMTAPCAPAPIVIATNDGYPLDRNVYQIVKGMAAAEKAATPDGVIILAAGCEDGVGHPEFHAIAKRYRDLGAFCRAMNAGDSEIDKWQLQVLARILANHRVILVSEGVGEETARDFFLDYASTVEEALELAYAIKGRDARVNILPNGPVVVPYGR